MLIGLIVLANAYVVKARDFKIDIIRGLKLYVRSQGDEYGFSRNM